MVSYGCQNAFWVSNVLVTLKSTETDGVYIITHSIGMETLFSGNGLLRDKQ